MIEIPESHVYARQAGDMLSGRTVTDVFNATYPHKFTWYTGDPAAYRNLLAGKKFLSAAGYGAFVDLLLEDKVHIALSDGVNMRYCPAGAGIPPKYQLLITFDDDSFLVFTVAMYGGINAFRDTLDNPYYLGALSKPSPLGDGFDAAYFDRLVAGAKPKRFSLRNSGFPAWETASCRIFFSMPGFILSGRWRRLVSVNWTRCSAL